MGAAATLIRTRTTPPTSRNVMRSTPTIATSSDFLRLWLISDDRVELKSLLNGSKNNEFCGPPTSFDWNGLVRVFHLRDKQHSTIIYGTNNDKRRGGDWVSLQLTRDWSAVKTSAAEQSMRKR